MGKPASSHQTRFQANEALELVSLHRDIHSGKYKPSRSICFVVTHPKPREIWASHFRDRIVHHLIVSQLEPQWERRFSARSFACRKRMGSHKAVRELCSLIRKVSRGGRRKAWVLQLDVASFFVSIDRAKVLELLLCGPMDAVLRNLVEKTFHHDYLTGVDHFIERELRPQGYLRYMDDMTLVDSSYERLEAMIEPVNNWLQTRRLQCLNDSKTTLKDASSQSIDYLGYRLRPDKINPSKVVCVCVDPKKKWDFVNELRNLEREGIAHGVKLHPLWHKYSHRHAREAWSAVRSREGHLKHTRAFRFAQKTLARTEASLNNHWVDLLDS